METLESLCLSAGDAIGPDLKRGFSQLGIKFGMGMRYAELSDSDLTAFVASKAGLVVPINDLKWKTTQPTEGTWDFTNGDAIAAFCAANGLAMRGHNLIWGNTSGNPSWMYSGTTAGNWASRQSDHAEQLLPRYTVTSWDVVVEPFADDGSGYRNSFWYAAAGTDYISNAFSLARTYCPTGTKLALCEYGLIHNDSKHRAKRALVLTLIETLATAGTIDNLSIQGHLNSGASFSEKNWRQFIQDCKSAGATNINITELDYEALTEKSTATIEKEKADLYKPVVEILLDENCSTEFLQWNITDPTSWKVYPYEDPQTYTQAPLLWDSSEEPKKAERVIRQALRSALG